MKFTWKKIVVGVLVVGVVAAIGVSRYRKAHAPVQYETAVVTKGTLKQTVDATGKVQSVNNLNLRFEVSGIIAAVNVREGQAIKKGVVIASLRIADLSASIAQAQANLNLKLAGATDQDKMYYKAALDSAQASLEQAENGTSLITTQAYENLLAALQASIPKLDDALTQADNILGIDNVSANEGFRTVLSNLDSSKLGIATLRFPIARNDSLNVRVKAAALTPQSNFEEIDAAATLGLKALQSMNELLNGVSDVLRVTPPQGTLTQATLDAKKSTIESTRNTINAQYAALTGKKQDVASSKTTLAQKQAAYDQALANYQSKIVAPREVDVASYRAALAQAVASRNKAIIVAPIDGVVNKLNGKIGETVSGADTIVQLLAPQYQVEVDIPETDVSKIKLNDSVIITLDAFGDDVKFSGAVMDIEPGATEVQGVVYYKVTVSLNDSGKAVKPGMTANISVKTIEKENAVSIPLRTVRTREDGTKYVRVLDNNLEKEVVVKLGFKADEGKVEVLEGLQEGQQVIISVK